MLITVDQAKRHLHFDNEDRDEEIEEKVNQASEIVLDYLKRDLTEWQDTAGEPDGVPYVIQAAVQLVVGALIQNAEGNSDDAQPLSQAVKDLVHRYRDPALA